MAKIDILLPFWGDVNLFKQTVLSVLAQDEPDWQLIIADDHYPSTEPLSFIESLADPRIQYYRHKENIGVTKNFNYVVGKASAEFCTVIGCDDVLLPNYISRSLEQIQDADFYQPGVDVIDKDGTSYKPLTDRVKRLLKLRSGVYSGNKLAASLCVGNWLYFPSILWRTEIIKKYPFDEQFKITQDVNLELSIIINGGKLVVDDMITFQYRRFGDSLSSKEKQRGGVRFSEEKKVYEKFSQEFNSIGWKKAARSAKIRLTSRLNQVISQ